MDTRAVSSPKPKANKPRLRRTSARRSKPESKLARKSDSEATAETKNTTTGAAPGPVNVPAPFQQPPGQYQYKPIMVRDMNSIPAMFKNMPSVIAQAPPVLPNVGPNAGHPDNILLMIAPQTQLNGKRRKTSVPAGKQPNPMMNGMMAMQRPRANSAPFMTEPAPIGLRTDQQMADYKRRKMMQYAYEQMEALVPAKFYDKPSRANVLMGAVEYIAQLKATVSQMELRLVSTKEPNDKPEENEPEEN